jgi:mono/diheme cytochrome c family protein/cytochrome c5
MKILKLALMLVAVLVLLAVGTFCVALWMGERKLERMVDVPVVPVPYTQDPAALKQGRYLFDSRGCAECHGENGGGRVFIDDQSSGMYVRTPNLTRGANSATAAYTEGDWVRAIRHGVSPSGHALLVMPAGDYNRISDPDFAALVAYVRSLQPVAGEPALVRLPAPVRALYGLGVLKDSSERIDHKLPPSPPVPVAANVEYGGYVATMCTGCHGPGFSGGTIPGGPPDWPPAANLTPGEGGVMGRYDTAEKFIAMMRTGKRPDGSEVDKAMPFQSLRVMNDVDLQAAYAFLKTVPARKAGEH